MYVFGLQKFETPNALVQHFQQQSLIGGESGVLTLLTHAYPRNYDAEGSGSYTKIAYHSTKGEDESASAVQGDGKEGGTDVKTRTIGRRKKRDVAVAKEAPDLSQGSKEGFLSKLGAIRKNYKRRWFVADKMALSYFKGREDSEPIRVLDLHTATRIALVDQTEEEADRLGFGFVLELPSRTSRAQ